MAAVSDLGMFKIFYPGSQSDLTGVEGEGEEEEEIRDTLEKETSKKFSPLPFSPPVSFWEMVMRATFSSSASRITV